MNLTEEKLLTPIDGGLATTPPVTPAEKALLAVEEKQAKAENLTAEAEEKRAEACRLEHEARQIKEDATTQKRHALLAKHRTDLFAGIQTEIAKHARNSAAEAYAAAHKQGLYTSTQTDCWKNFDREVGTLWDAMEAIARDVYHDVFWEEIDRLKRQAPL